MKPQPNYQIPQPTNPEPIETNSIADNHPVSATVPAPPSYTDPASSLIRNQVQNLHNHPATEDSIHTTYRQYRDKIPSFQQPGSQPQVTQTQAFQSSQRDLPAQSTYQQYNQQPISGVIESHQRSIAQIKQQLLRSVRTDSTKPTGRWKPFIVALSVGLAFLGITYNEIAVAQFKQYVSPGSSLSTPIIIDPNSNIQIGLEPKLIIPKINVDVPVVYDVTTYDEAEIQDGLERGVVHYGNTALPGQNGNNVIVGHSSNNFFNSGAYKFAFVLLDRLEKGDTFILHFKGQRYIYKVFNKQVIEPNDFSLIQPTDSPIVTLITCTPPGTSWHRLVVQAQQISPDPTQVQDVKRDIPQDINTPVPGNAPSFWQNFFNLF